MSENKNHMNSSEREESNNKTELANRIANQSKMMADKSQNILDNLLKLIRWFSTMIDRTLFNTRHAKLVSLTLAIMMWFVVNASSVATLYTPMTYSKDRNGVTITAKYNTDTFELSGLPSTADITISGDTTSVNNAINSRGTVVADLEGLTEGTHQVKLTAEGYGDSVSVKIDPSNVIITLKKKTTQQFDLSYDFVNQDKMDSIYSVGTPVFEYTKVNVRASKDTLSSIAFVKALIDVSGQTGDFTQEAKLVVYNSSGQPVDASIVPSTVSVTVPVTSPNKTVPIEVEVTGEAPEGKAIESISMDQQTVTIYGPQSVLSQIDKVAVTLNASTLTKDESTLLRPIALPAGVNSSNINQITMNVVLGEGMTKEITDVKINYRNNVNNYKASQPNNQTTTSVMVFGTEENIESITADDIIVYVDMLNAVPGLQEFPLQVEQPEGGLVTYTLTEATYTLNVLGESNTDSDTNTEADVNNG